MGGGGGGPPHGAGQEVEQEMQVSTCTGMSKYIVYIPECGFNEVNKTMYFEVHVLVEGQKLNALKHIKDIQLLNIHVHHILRGERG